MLSKTGISGSPQSWYNTWNSWWIIWALKESAEAAEFICIQCFCEYVGNIIMHINVGKGDFIWLDMLTKKMVLDVDMFYAVM